MTTPRARSRQPARRAKSAAVQAVLDAGKPRRPMLRYHGGKWTLAPFILDHFPAHRVYVEPFCGAASILLRKARAYAEIINDLNSDVVTLFRVCRDPEASARLVREIELTPFSREEFEAAYGETDDPVEQARRLVVRSFQGFGPNAVSRRTTGFRSSASRKSTTPAHDWRAWPEALVEIIDRLRGVVVENKDALDVMRQHDSPSTLHYVDPPYVLGTRAQRSPSDASYRRYSHDMSDDDHVRLASFCRGLKGYVVISGYSHPIYDERLRDWLKVTTKAHADGAESRVESLWINPSAAGMLDPAVLTAEQFGRFLADRRGSPSTPAFRPAPDAGARAAKRSPQRLRA